MNVSGRDEDVSHLTSLYMTFTPQVLDRTQFEKSGPESPSARFFRAFHGSGIPERLQPAKICADPALTKRKSRETRTELP
ncbi:unnamed protein product [Adineta ricciae]|uniref:Uncharacterized protein n=1 Tax=Adineta ricciae TaxID=249248 RepID=A0A815G0D4_ADIRI|nr:unnamed protein product [Adineta ricciae]CAF1628532.1 unnamed protein product [Adineta ricciae]